MSHSYFITDLPQGASLEDVKAAETINEVGLSNIHHHDLQEALEWNKREFRATDGSNDTMETLWETTRHDTKPIGVDGDEFLTQLDEHYDAVVAAIGEEPADWIYQLAVEADEKEKFVYIF